MDVDHFGAIAMEQRDPPSERILARIKNNRLVAVLIVVGTVVIALSTFTDATKHLLDLFKRQSQESARLELNNLSWGYTQQAFVERARQGDVRAVKLYLAAGMDPDANDRIGETALTRAAAANRTEVIQLLLKAKANVNQRTQGGYTALEVAAFQGNLDSVRLLLDHGTDLRAINEAFISAAEGAHVEVMSALLEKGANLNEVGPRALYLSVRSTKAGVNEQDLNTTVAFLLSHGVDVNTRNKQAGTLDDGETPLMVAVYSWENEPSVVRTLLNGGADVNIKDNRGQTPFWMAAAHGSADLVQMLLDRGADIGSRDNEGETPLMVAAENGHTSVVRTLLERGAHLNDKDAKGRTALQLAKESERAETVLLLSKAGAR